MRGAYTQFCKEKGCAVEEAKALHAEACERRLARIQNGKEPSHINGPEKPPNPKNPNQRITPCGSAN
jgi:hypothetical protein